MEWRKRSRTGRLPRFWFIQKNFPKTWESSWFACHDFHCWLYCTLCTEDEGRQHVRGWTKGSVSCRIWYIGKVSVWARTTWCPDWAKAFWQIRRKQLLEPLPCWLTHWHWRDSCLKVTRCCCPNSRRPFRTQKLQQLDVCHIDIIIIWSHMQFDSSAQVSWWQRRWR